MNGMDRMDGKGSDEELFLTQNSFSQEILQPNFSINSILDAIEGSDEPRLFQIIIRLFLLGHQQKAMFRPRTGA